MQASSTHMYLTKTHKINKNIPSFQSYSHALNSNQIPIQPKNNPLPFDDLGPVKRPNSSSNSSSRTVFQLFFQMLMREEGYRDPFKRSLTTFLFGDRRGQKPLYTSKSIQKISLKFLSNVDSVPPTPVKHLIYA